MNAGRGAEQNYLERELYELVRSDSRIFEFLQTGSLDGIWYWDIEHPENEWLSPRFWELFGYDASEKAHLAREWQDLIHPDDLAAALENFRIHCADPSHPYDQIVRFRHKDGSTVWVRCRGLAIRDASGRPIRMLGAHNDLTELRRAEEQLRGANELLTQRAARLQTLNDSLVEFTYAASHDLRQPLVTVDSYLRQLRECGTLDPESADLVRRANAAVSRMERLLAGLLDFARSGPRRETSEVDLSAAVEEARLNLMASIDRASAKLDVAPLPRVEGNRFDLMRVFQNLIGNALKFVWPDRRPHVQITSEPDDGMAHLIVRDNGIGIDPRYHGQLFGLFRRLPGSEPYEGTGVGLALCRRIVESHGGRIWIESLPGQGTTVHFTLLRQPGT